MSSRSSAFRRAIRPLLVTCAGLVCACPSSSPGPSRPEGAIGAAPAVAFREDFEASDLAAWVQSDANGVIQVDAAVARTGKQSLRFQSEAADEEARVFRMLPISDLRGKRVRVTLFARTADPATRAHLRVYSLQDGDMLTKEQSELSATSSQGDWAELVAEVNVPSVADAVHVGLELVGKGTVWIDDLVTEVHPAKPQHRLFRSAGALFCDPETLTFSFELPKLFDAVIFVNKTTRARPNPTGRRPRY